MGSSVIQVPQGQIVRIWQEGAFSFRGVIDGNVRLSVSSRFGSMVSKGAETQGGLGKLLDFAISELFGGGDSGTGFSTVFPQVTVRVWESTDPIKINFDLTYIQGLWGMSGPGIVSEVKRIMALSLPSLGGALGTLIPPGPTIATAYSSPEDVDEQGTTATSLFSGGTTALAVNALNTRLAELRRQKEAFSSGSEGEQAVSVQGNEFDMANGIQGYHYRRGRAINLQIGNYLRLNNILVEASDPEFSDICDASGFPVWAKISVTASTIMTATTNMLGIDKNGNAVAVTGGID